MTAESVYLVTQRLLGDLEVFRLPSRPALPEIAAAPPRHHQNSLTVGELIELFGLQFAFQTYRIQPHIFHVADFIV